MKLCLIILAISVLGYSNGLDVAPYIQCEADEITKIDGCVPAKPSGDPPCMAKCLDHGSQCTIKDVQLYVYDKISHYEEECPQEYREEVECETRVRRDCAIKPSTGNVGCSLTCTNQTVHDCYNSTRPTHRLTHRKVCTQKLVDDCIKVWVEEPCSGDPSQICKVYKCDPSAPAPTIRPVRTCKAIQELEKSEESYLQCDERQIQTCEQKIEQREVYDELVSCKREPYEDCWTDFIPAPCIQKHVLIPRVFEITRKVAVCDNGSNFDSPPYIFDACESAACTVLDPLIYEFYTGQPGYVPANGTIFGPIA